MTVALANTASGLRTPDISSSQAPPRPPWPRLREELKLAKGPLTGQGAPTWTIHDPVANQFFRIGWLEFEILNRWNLADPQKIVAAIRQTTPIQLTETHIERFVQFLQDNQLLKSSFQGAAKRLLQKKNARQKGLLQTLLRNYLYFRIPVLRPDRFLTATLPLVRFVFSYWFVALTAVISLTGIYLIAENWSHFVNGFDFLATPDGALYFIGVLFFSKCCHELGHGYAAKRFGCSVPRMGIGVIVFWPILWTDTTDAWKIRDRHKRLIINGAGIYAELIVAAFAALLWAFLDDGPLRSSIQMLAATTWVLTLMINLNPIMKFDGYFLLSDGFEVPNLQSRALVYARWWYRSKCYGLSDPPPEYPERRTKRFMLLYALFSSIYRFFIMISIALAIYFFFFKALGMMLILFQIMMFPVLPILSEMAVCWKKRADIQWFPNFLMTLLMLTAVSAVFWIPWKNTLTVPAVWLAERETAIYAPSTARITAIFVKNHQAVETGQPLYQLESPHLEHRIVQTRRRIRQIQAEIESNQLHEKRLEQNAVRLQEYYTLQADLDGFLKEKAQLTLQAPFNGTIVDLPSGIHGGDWISKKEILGLLVCSRKSKMIAFIPERHLTEVQVDQQVQFYPDRFRFRSIAGHTLSVDDTAVKTLAYPELASVFGGRLPARRDETGGLIPVGSHYKIRITPDEPWLKTGQVVSGRAEIEIVPVSLFQRFRNRALGILIRESGL